MRMQVSSTSIMLPAFTAITAIELSANSSLCPRVNTDAVLPRGSSMRKWHRLFALLDAIALLAHSTRYGPGIRKAERPHRTGIADRAPGHRRRIFHGRPGFLHHIDIAAAD